MSICIAIAVPDGIALAADTQSTWNQKITSAREKGTGRLIELQEPINIPVGWSKMAKKLFGLKFGDSHYAVCAAGMAQLNSKSIFSIFKSLEKTYQGADRYEDVLIYLIEGIKQEMRKQLRIENLWEASQVLFIEFILAGHEDKDVSKPRIESHTVFSGTPQIHDVPNPTGQFQRTSNAEKGNREFGGCWIGRTEFISHIVNHANRTLPAIQGQYDLLSLSDAIDYTKFLVEFTCDFQRFAIMVPDCGRPVVSATLTPEGYMETIIE